MYNSSWYLRLCYGDTAIDALTTDKQIIIKAGHKYSFLLLFFLRPVYTSDVCPNWLGTPCGMTVRG